MKRKQPPLWKPLAFFTSAGLLWIISGYTEPRLLTSIVYLFMFAACGGLIFSGLDYLTYTVARRWADFASIHNAAYLDVLREENIKLSWLAKLDSDQVVALGRYTASIETIPGTGMIPLQFLIVGDRKITFEFVDEFLMMGGKDYLAAVRRWSEGSNKRLDADALTNYFVRNKYAVPPNGNTPARWIDRPAGLQSIGMEE